MSDETAGLLKRLSASIGVTVAGRLQTPDGSRYIDFTNQTCDPKTYADLMETGTALGLRPSPPDHTTG